MMPTRRDFLKLLLASAAAEAVDFEKLLWVPKPIITVPALLPPMPGTYGAINRATSVFWRNQASHSPQAFDALGKAMWEVINGSNPRQLKILTDIQG